MSRRRAGISFAESAIADLKDIIDYYSEQGVPEVGKQLVADRVTDIELLAEQPDMGHKVPEFDLDFLRELIRPPFRIVYRRDMGKVRIVRIWRSERQMRAL